jgi:hypothetical protein
MKKQPGKDKKLPSTPRGWCLYRAKLNCKIGRDTLDREAESTRLNYAVFCLLHAVADIAEAMDIDSHMSNHDAARELTKQAQELGMGYEKA